MLGKAFPVVLDGLGFESLPNELRGVNGLRLDAYTVKATASRSLRHSSLNS